VLLVKEIHVDCEKLDISGLIAIFLDVGLMPHSMPLHILVDSIPDLFLRVFIQNASKNWSSDYCVLLMRLLGNPALPQFRSWALKRASDSLKALLAFLGRLVRFQAEFAISHFLSSVARLMSELQPSDFDFLQFFELAIQLFMFLEQDERLRNKPSILLGFMSIFFPLRFSHLFETGSRLLTLMTETVLSMVLGNPRVFFQFHLFII
jgi:hypothetical protein